jgi:hypothetical protein
MFEIKFVDLTQSEKKKGKQGCAAETIADTWNSDLQKTSVFIPGSKF